MTSTRIVSALILALMSATSLAPAANSLPLVATDSLPTTGWFSYRFDVAETTPVAFGIEGQVSASSTIASGYWLYRDQELIGAFLFTQYGNGQQQHVELPVVGTVHSEDVSTSSSNPGLEIGWTLDPGTYVAVVMQAVSGNGSSSGYLRGGPAVSLVNRTSGGDVFMRWERDFNGGATALANKPPARAFAMAGGSTTEALDAPFYGWFTNAPYGAQAAILRWRGPEETSGMSTSVTDPGGSIFFGAPAGSYRFEATASAGAVLATVIVWGGAVTLA